MIYIFHFVFDHYTEDKSLVQYVEGYHPLKLLADWCFWFIVHYFIYRGNQKSLAKKKRELGAAREKYGLGEEPAP